MSSGFITFTCRCFQLLMTSAQTYSSICPLLSAGDVPCLKAAFLIILILSLFLLPRALGTYCQYFYLFPMFNLCSQLDSSHPYQKGMKVSQSQISFLQSNFWKIRLHFLTYHSLLTPLWFGICTHYFTNTALPRVASDLQHSKIANLVSTFPYSSYLTVQDWYSWPFFHSWNKTTLFWFSTYLWFSALFAFCILL